MIRNGENTSIFNGLDLEFTNVISYCNYLLSKAVMWSDIPTRRAGKCRKIWILGKHKIVFATEEAGVSLVITLSFKLSQIPYKISCSVRADTVSILFTSKCQALDRMFGK